MEGSQAPLDGPRPGALSAAFSGAGYAGAPGLAAEPLRPPDLYLRTYNICIYVVFVSTLYISASNSKNTQFLLCQVQYFPKKVKKGVDCSKVAESISVTQERYCVDILARAQLV